jgi:hypothetical protein
VRFDVAFVGEYAIHRNPVFPDMKNHQFKQQSIIRHDSYRGWIPSVGDVLLLGLER